MSARLAVSIGCPCGIGPEVSVVAASALATKRGGPRILLVGDLGALRAAARLRGIDPARLVRVDDPRRAAFWTTSRGGLLPVYEPVARLSARERAFGKPSAAAGAAQLAFVDAATDLVAAGSADALVTGPVSKDAIARSGAPGASQFRGHTEHLAARLDAPEVTMAFWSEELTTSLVTTHLPLAEVPRAVTATSVARAAYWTGRFVAELGGPPKPVAVAALNPHAGEGGLLGDEELDEIAPGILLGSARLLRDGYRIPLAGPVGAETAFRRAAAGAYAAVVAMYHDQATIPMKLLGFGEAVNVSLGLPIVRTSVDHGTAYDLAGKGRADPRGMTEALALAARLVARAASGGAGRRAGRRATRRRSGR
jgi:4-hydroxythreonine-4-phosphate dehydrogenase